MRESKNPKNAMLAPLAGVTDIAFRMICENYGASKTFTEMVSVNALAFDNKASRQIIASPIEEKNCNIQIFGNDPLKIEKVVKEVINPIEKFKEISFNMGCPAPKIFNNNQGSALLKDIHLIEKIVKTLRKSTEKIINVKYRLGVDDNSINYLDVGRVCEDNGCDYVILHARTKEQKYQGKARWDDIKKLKENLSIPVIANGDVYSVNDFIDIIEKTKADGVMVARGAMGNPFIFRQIDDYLNNRQIRERQVKEIFDTMKDQYNLSLKYKDEKLVINQMRKHVGWYVKGLEGAAEFRNELNQLKDTASIFKLINEYEDELEGKYGRK